MAALCSWCPKHQRLHSTVHGGQAPVWQVWLTSWPQSLGLEHGLLHGSGLVPQEMGGYNTLEPHSQYNSSKLVSRHGGHRPLWHVSGQRCRPHDNWRLHGSGQTCSISMQQRWLHLCFPHNLFWKKESGFVTKHTHKSDLGEFSFKNGILNR